MYLESAWLMAMRPPGSTKRASPAGPRPTAPSSSAREPGMTPVGRRSPPTAATAMPRVPRRAALPRSRDHAPRAGHRAADPVVHRRTRARPAEELLGSREVVGASAHVMAGLVPATHEHDCRKRSWVAGIPRFALQPAMTWIGRRGSPMRRYLALGGDPVSRELLQRARRDDQRIDAGGVEDEAQCRGGQGPAAFRRLLLKLGDGGEIGRVISGSKKPGAASRRVPGGGAGRARYLPLSRPPARGLKAT